MSHRQRARTTRSREGVAFQCIEICLLRRWPEHPTRPQEGPRRNNVPRKSFVRDAWRRPESRSSEGDRSGALSERRAENERKRGTEALPGKLPVGRSGRPRPRAAAATAEARKEPVVAAKPDRRSHYRGLGGRRRALLHPLRGGAGRRAGRGRPNLPCHRSTHGRRGKENLAMRKKYFGLCVK